MTSHAGSLPACDVMGEAPFFGVSSASIQTEGASEVAGNRGALAVLRCRAVRGSTWSGSTKPPSPQVHQAIEGFMLQPEHWSLQLQRHCPNDWNACSAVVLRCLNQAA